MAPSPIVFGGVNHFYGAGSLRRQVLHGVSGEVAAGEIVILTGPSGSGKTTLVTLLGALRSVQAGSVQILGRELNGAGPRGVQSVRRNIGYIFQAHNLLPALTAVQNTEMSLRLHHGRSPRAMRARALTMLERVGLGHRVEQVPAELSGGERQRVAIARALATEPRIIIADEPTASLDRASGRAVVELMQELAREQGVTVVMVTHDNRVLDVADRIVYLEDGRLSSFTDAATTNARTLMSLVAHNNRQGHLARQVAEMSAAHFTELLEQVTRESQEFLRVFELARNDTFESMIEQSLEAFTLKLAQVIGADRASLYLVDEERREVWLKVGQDETGRPIELRMPMSAGLAGHVATTGEILRIDDAYDDPRFNRSVDRDTGYRTRSVLCVPIRNRRRQVFAVAQLLNRQDGGTFDGDDEQRLMTFVDSIGVVLETWWEMKHRIARASTAASA